MGLTLCKRSCCYCCCSPCCLCPCCSEDHPKINSIDVLADVKLKVLLLGQLGSGKTEVGHALSHRPRLDYESTNGVQYYRVPLARIVATSSERASGHMAITEIGGNEEMQKIWPHYYAQALAIIYCFDLSASAVAIGRTLQLLQQVLRHEFVRGKPILLVATKSQLVDSGVQLYDIENDYQLEQLARTCGSSIRLCSYECASEHADQPQSQQAVGSSLALGIQWLAKYLLDNWCMLSIRVKCDENTKQAWQEQQQRDLGGPLISHMPSRRHRGRFWRFSQLHRLARSAGGRVRPHTAPPRVTSISHACQQQQQQIALHLSDATNANTNATTTITTTSTIDEGVRATAAAATITTIATTHVSKQVCSGPVPNGHIKPHSGTHVTDIY